MWALLSVMGWGCTPGTPATRARVLGHCEQGQGCTPPGPERTGGQEEAGGQRSSVGSWGAICEQGGWGGWGGPVQTHGRLHTVRKGPVGVTVALARLTAAGRVPAQASVDGGCGTGGAAAPCRARGKGFPPPGAQARPQAGLQGRVLCSLQPAHGLRLCRPWTVPSTPQCPRGAASRTGEDGARRCPPEVPPVHCADAAVFLPFCVHVQFSPQPQTEAWFQALCQAPCSGGPASGSPVHLRRMAHELVC